MRTQLISCGLALTLGVAAGCASRTAAATQPTPAAFDPSQSDPQALGVVGEMTAAIGGAEAWAAVKQIRWEKKHKLDGKLNAWFRHSWDIWNGRHRFETADMATLAEAQAQGKPELLRFNLAMYDLFDRNKGAVFPGGNMAQQAIKADRDRFVQVAFDTWKQDSYELAFIHKLQDPGVKLTYIGEVKDVNGYCKPSCHEIKVTFDPLVGTDTYYIDINTETKLPELLQKQRGAGRIGFALLEWTTVGGLKFPQKLLNVGGASEEVELSGISIGAPDDELYVPPVR